LIKFFLFLTSKVCNTGPLEHVMRETLLHCYCAPNVITVVGGNKQLRETQSVVGGFEHLLVTTATGCSWFTSLGLNGPSASSQDCYPYWNRQGET